MSVESVPVLPASTVLLLRDTSSGIEVLMVERPRRGFFGGLMVFPGGAEDEGDDSELARSVVPGRFEDHSSRVAALREVAEEVGIALVEGEPVRSPVGVGEDVLTGMDLGGLRFDASALHLISRWVTPEGAPKRFDTRFYLAAVSYPPEVRLAEPELAGYSWTTAKNALDKLEAGDWQMFTPTIAHLSWLTKRPTVEDAVAAAQGADGRSLVAPRIMEDGSIVPIHLPSDQ